MMPISFYKLLSFLLLVTSPVRGSTKIELFFEDPFQKPCHEDLPPILPPECKNFTLIKGNPFTAKTLLIGEKHSVCDDARYVCTYGLLAARASKENAKKINPKSSILLFENYAHDKQIRCEDLDYQHLSDDCNGWNIADELFYKMVDNVWKSAVLRTILDKASKELKPLLSPELTEAQRKIQAERYITNQIKAVTRNLARAEEEHQVFMKEFGNKKPQLYSFYLEVATREKFCLDYWKEMLKELKNTGSLSIIADTIYPEFKTYRSILKSYIADYDASLRRPNQALVKAIYQASKQDKVTVAYAGDWHVTKRREEAGSQQQIVQELYDDLDKFADENPYAVLSCTL